MKPPLKTYLVSMCLSVVNSCNFRYALEDPTCLGTRVSTQEMFVLMRGQWLFVFSPIIGASNYGKRFQKMVLDVLTLAKVN
jgi:hypothetical protein